MTENYINYLEEVFDYIVNGKGLVGEISKETVANKPEEERRDIRWKVASGSAVLLCKKDNKLFLGSTSETWEFMTKLLSLWKPKREMNNDR
jgi:hypothetical protein